MAGFTFLNRDISWLYFNERVLMEAENEQVPLRERINFLSIFSSNLDEFYRVRMPALLALQKIKKQQYNSDTSKEVNEMIGGLLNRYGAVLTKSIIPELLNKNVVLLYNETLPEPIQPIIQDYFFSQVAGFLQPIKLSKEKEGFFPENNQLYMAVIADDEEGEELLFLLNIPCDTISRFFKVIQSGVTYIIFLEDIISHHLRYIFPGYAIKGSYNIKITRDAELDLKDEYGEDLAEKIEIQLSKRDMGLATRFLFEPGLPLRQLEYIIQSLNLEKASVVEGGRYHNLKDLAALPFNDPTVAYATWPSINPIKEMKEATLHEYIAQGDVIVHAPYQSYDTILRFFNEAAIDPKVEEIYTTLYRVANDSRIVHALISAAKNGKKVSVLVELKARFDEANNIHWAKKLKEAGAKIYYSDNALKVHAKIALVKREHDSLPLLGLLATGNLNEKTARFYTDHMLLTASQPMLEEMKMLFTFLSKKKQPAKDENIVFNHLIVAQFNLLEKFSSLIEQEIQNAENGLPASIIIKLNNLEEEGMISKLYKASNAGVQIQLIIRGICRLIPGIAGQSENITVKRIVDKYLEHGRIFIFHNNGQEKMYLGSADWMNRNIFHRIEVCFPVQDTKIREQIQRIVAFQWKDNVQAVMILPDGGNKRIQAQGSPLVRSQEAIYKWLSSLY